MLQSQESAEKVASEEEMRGGEHQPLDEGDVGGGLGEDESNQLERGQEIVNAKKDDYETQWRNA